MTAVGWILASRLPAGANRLVKMASATRGRSTVMTASNRSSVASHPAATTTARVPQVASAAAASRDIANAKSAVPIAFCGSTIA